MVKTDSVVIPIHDSFLVKQRDLPDLIEAIHYAEVTLAKEINRSIRVPQLKIEASRLNHQAGMYRRAVSSRQKRRFTL